MQRARDINLGGIGQAVAALRLDGIFRRDHRSVDGLGVDGGWPPTASVMQLPGKLLKVRGAMEAVRKDSLRQHYLEQVQRVCGAPAQHSQPSPRPGTGWLPVITVNSLGR